MVDARLTLFLFFISAAFAWQLPLHFLLLVVVLCLVMIYVKTTMRKQTFSLLNKLFLFIVFWSFGIFLLKSFTYAGGRFLFIDLEYNIYFSCYFAARLFTLGLIGILIPLYTDVHSFALAATWYLKPVLRKNAWYAGLAATLVLQLIPRIFIQASQLRKTLLYRLVGKRISYFSKIYIYMTALLRILAMQNYKQSIALVARGLDRSEVWEKQWETKISFALLYAHKFELMLFCLVFLCYFI